MKIINHRLEGTSVSFKQTANFYKPPFKTTTGLPDSIIIHYTAMNSLEGAERVLTTKFPKNNASAHILIGKNGEIKQLSSFDCRTWHAGISMFNGRESYNNFSVGIEIDNVGWLQKYPDGSYSRPELFKLGFKLQDKDIVRAKHFNPLIKFEYWEKYTDAQVNTVFEVCKLLCKTYGIKEILGHDQIAHNRKQDPGPAFPMDVLRNTLISGTVDSRVVVTVPKKGMVAVDVLNIRSGAGIEFAKVANPLPFRTPVEILEEQNGWYRVSTRIEGWVSKSFINSIE